MLDVARPYPAYKESDLPWLGEVPEHWELRRGKTLFTKANRAVRPEDETVTCFRDGQVTLRKNRRTTGFTEAIAEHGYQGVRKGDLVIHAMDAFAGAVGVSDSDGKASPICGIGIPNHLAIATYFAYAVREMARRQWILALAKGIRERSTDFRFDTFGNQFLPTPPIDEQAAIVKVLSAVDRRVNRLVRAKRRLLALLAEQKQAVITHAVTRGLDLSAPTKPSGVPWLGEVPAHWEVKRLGSIFRERGETNQDASMGIGDILSVTRTRGVIPYAEKGNIGNSYSDDITRYKIVREGDLVINCMNVIIGSLGLSRYDGCLSPVYYVLQLRNEHDYGRYFEAMFQNPRFHKGLVVYGKGILAHRMRIPMDALKTVLLPLPPATEQRAICESFADQTRQFDAAADLARREIDLIREYRTRLVADIVTGKLDVRAVADALPDEVEDEEPMETDEAEADSDAGEPELVEELAEQ